VCIVVVWQVRGFQGTMMSILVSAQTVSRWYIWCLLITCYTSSIHRSWSPLPRCISYHSLVVFSDSFVHRMSQNYSLFSFCIDWNSYLLLGDFWNLFKSIVVCINIVFADYQDVVLTLQFVHCRVMWYCHNDKQCMEGNDETYQLSIHICFIFKTKFNCFEIMMQYVSYKMSS